MDRIERLMAGRESLPDSRLKVDYRDGTAEVKFDGGRSQTVCIERARDGYVFTSIVLGSSRQGTTRKSVELCGLIMATQSPDRRGKLHL